MTNAPDPLASRARTWRYESRRWVCIVCGRPAVDPATGLPLTWRTCREARQHSRKGAVQAVVSTWVLVQ